jgi:MFS family permease
MVSPSLPPEPPSTGGVVPPPGTDAAPATGRLVGQMVDDVPTIRQLWPVAGAFASIGLLVGSWQVATPELSDLLGGPGQFGLVLSVGLLASAVAAAVGGMLAERKGTSVLLTTSMLVWAALVVTTALMPARWPLAALLVVTFGINGLLDVAANIAATAAFSARPGRLVQMHSSFNFGGVFGCLLVGVALGVFGPAGWRWVWPLIAAAAAVSALRSRKVPMPADADGEHVRLLDGLRALRRERLVVVAVAFALGAVVEGGVGTWGVLHLRRQLDAGLLLGAGGAVVGFAVAAVVRASMGRVQTRRAANQVLVVGTGAATVGLLALALAPWPAVAALGLVAAASGIAVTWPLLLAEVGRDQERPAVLVGAASTLGYVGLVGGPVVLGAVVAAWGTRVALVLVAVLAALIAPCALVHRRRTA